MECTLCGKKDEDLKHLSLYVIGSEGINVCLHCRVILTRVAKGIMENSQRVKLRTIKMIKENSQHVYKSQIGATIKMEDINMTEKRNNAK